MPMAPPDLAKPWWIEDDDDKTDLNGTRNTSTGQEIHYRSDDDDHSTDSSLFVEDVTAVRHSKDDDYVNPEDSLVPPRTARPSRSIPEQCHLPKHQRTANTSASKTSQATAARPVTKTTLNSSNTTTPSSFQAKWANTKKVIATKASQTLASIRDVKPPTSTTTTTPPTGAASLTSTSTNGGGRDGDGRSHRDRSESSRISSSSSHGKDPLAYRRHTVQELIQSMEQGVMDLPPALERRVRDFKFAQQKRRERAGGSPQSAWGIFGLYAHLSDIRADLEWAEDAAWRRQRSEPYLSWTDFEKSRDKGLNNRPWFTYSLLAICTLMLIVTWGVNGWKIEPLNVNPLIGPSSETLIKVGARKSDLIVNQGQYFRLFTPLVLHAGLIHYILNMTALYFIGGAVEQSHGWLSACVLFVVPAVGGNILGAICLPQYISVGASGGIFGLIGGCLADIAINWNLLFLKSTTEEGDRWRHGMVLFWLIMDILVNCIIGLTPFVDNFTHLGGLIYGLLCGLSTIEKLAVGFFGLQSQQEQWKIYFFRSLGLVTSILAIMISTVLLVRSDGVVSPCSGCRYLSCVPFPPNAQDKWWECDDCDFVIADLFVRPEDGLYEEVALTCPDRQMESIDVSAKQWYDKDSVRKALPSLCRDHCDNVFATKKG